MATYYVRADGSAANKAAATSDAAASTSMNVAVHNSESFSPGDIIVVSDAGGTYDLTTAFAPPSSGSAGNPITYRRNTGGTPTLRAGTTNMFQLVEANADWIVYEELTLNGLNGANTADHGFHINGNEYNWIRGCSISNVDQVGILGRLGVRLLCIENNTINGTGQSGIRANDPGAGLFNEYWTIAGNTFTNINSTTTEGHGAVQTDGAADRHRYFYIYNNDADCSTYNTVGFGLDSLRSSEVLNNKITCAGGTNREGIALTGAYNTVSGNRIYAPGWSGIMVWCTDIHPTSDILIEHNYIDGSGGSGWDAGVTMVFSDTTPMTNIVIRRNRVLNKEWGVRSYQDGTTQDNYVGCEVYENHLYTADLTSGQYSFVNATDPDLSVYDNYSAAIVSAGWDIGPDEYISTSATELGAASLTGTAVVSAVSSADVPAVASISGTATIAGAGLVTRNAAVSLIGTGTLDSAGLLTKQSSIAIDATATIVSAGLLTKQSSVVLDATATLVSDGTVVGVQTGQAALDATATLTSAGLVTRNAASSISGTATLSADGTTGAIELGAVSLDATATVSAAALLTKSTSVTLSGTVTLAAVPSTDRADSVLVSGTATVSAAPSADRDAAIAINGTATVNAIGTLGGEANGTAALDATATLSASPSRDVESTISLDATATISAAGDVFGLAAGAAALTALATVQPVPGLLVNTTVALDGTATISALGTLSGEANGVAALDATATISAVGDVAGVQQGAAQLSGTATLAADPSLDVSRASALDATATISAAGTTGTDELGTISLTGTATLSSAGLLTKGATIALSGTATLSAAGTTGQTEFGIAILTANASMIAAGGVQRGIAASITSVAIVTAQGTGVGDTHFAVADITGQASISAALRYIVDYDEYITIKYSDDNSISLLYDDENSMSLLLTNEEIIILTYNDDEVW